MSVSVCDVWMIVATQGWSSVRLKVCVIVWVRPTRNPTTKLME